MPKALPGFTGGKMPGRCKAEGGKEGNLVHKPSTPQAMKIPSANAAVDKEWSKYKNLPAWEKIEEASDLFRLPKSACPTSWIRLPRSRCPRSWDRIQDLVGPLERH